MLAIFLACLAFALCGIRAVDLDVTLDAADVTLDHLTERLSHLTERLDDLLLSWEEGEAKQQRLGYEVQKLPGGTCRFTEGQFQCGESAQCLNKVLVCDGSADCRNGADELPQVCQSPFQKHVSYLGVVVYNHCMKHGLRNREIFFITGMEVIMWFTNKIKVSRLFIALGVGGTSSTLTVFESDGQYDFFTREMVFDFTTSALGQRVHGVCTADNFNEKLVHCHLYSSVMGTADPPCAYGYYVRR